MLGETHAQGSYEWTFARNRTPDPVIDVTMLTSFLIRISDIVNSYWRNMMLAVYITVIELKMQ